VYVHCRGGIGRTGTVIGCWLARNGLTGQAALDRIAELRAGTPDGYTQSPETAAQRAFVLAFAAEDLGIF
jgi:protein-tyrosine phosphatase